MGLDWQNNNFARASARASRFFVYFLAVVARLQSESASFHVLSRTGTQLATTLEFNSKNIASI